jgi:hypothetical protein
MSKLNILFLSAHLPVLGVHGGGVRMYHNLRILSERHSVTLLSFIEQEREVEHVPELERLGIEVRTVLRRPGRSKQLLIPKPREHDEYSSDEMHRLVRETMLARRFDVVQAEFIQMGQHVPAESRLLKILTEHEVQFANAHLEYRAESQPLLKAQKFYEC